MTSSNLLKTKVEEDEVATTDPIESKEEQLEYNQGHDAVEGGNKVDSPEKQPKQKGGEGDGAPSSPSNQDQSTTVPPTPVNPNTPGQHSASTATTATPGPLTPAVQQIPIQPYSYPPYSYYPPTMGYPPPPTMHPGGHQTDHMMTGANNPYQYTDVSNLSDPVPDTRRNRGGVTEPFPEKLHRMLDGTEREGLADIVSFFSHGRAFAIHKPRRFVNEVMPRYFRQTRLTSFQRQLNLYGFRRISQGPDNGGYYHELFLKGRKGLCVNMKRTKVKGAAKLKRDPDSEPNFYSYPPIKQDVPTNSVTSPGNVASPGRPTTSPSVHAYPGYGYPPPMPPPQYPYSTVPNAPYTAAQQPNAPVYSYPPYYGYPWYPPPPTGQLPPHSPSPATPQTSPITTGVGGKKSGAQDKFSNSQSQKDTVTAASGVQPV